MATATDTVHDRVTRVRTSLTRGQIATGAAIVLTLGFALLFVQEPLVHDAMHNFRHAAGVTCH